MQWIRAHLKVLVPAVVGVLAVLAYLAFGVFGVQFLFIDDTVDEAGPVFASGAGASTTVTETPPTTAPATASSSSPTPAGDGSTTAGGSTPAPPPTLRPEPTTPPTTAPPILTLVEGTFIPRDHPGEGIATVLTDGSSQRFLRFEQFATDNGPDLNVYLTASDAEGPEGAFDDDFVDLGNLKGNVGDQNYEIPPDVDLDRYDTVVVWCVRFSSAFTAADLVPLG